MKRSSFLIRDILQEATTNNEHNRDDKSWYEDRPSSSSSFPHPLHHRFDFPFIPSVTSSRSPFLSPSSASIHPHHPCLSCISLHPVLEASSSSSPHISVTPNNQSVVDVVGDEDDEEEVSQSQESSSFSDADHFGHHHQVSSSEELHSHLHLHHPTSDSGGVGRKIRRNRTVFTELQLMGLERRFDSQKYLSTPDRADLARVLGLTQLQVKTWYQNRRMKWKKQVMQGGCPVPPTKPKGRPKKNSIPSLGILDSIVLLASVSASNTLTLSAAPSSTSSA